MKQVWDENMADEDEDDDDDENVVFGITTALNLTSAKARSQGSIQQLKAIILERAEKNANDNTLKMLRDILTNESIETGLIINERYVNIPAPISVPMLENLCKEINRANEKNKPFNFAYYIMVLKFHRKEAKAGKPKEDIFSNPEEELFLKESLLNFEYSVQSEIDAKNDETWKEDGKLVPFRKVVILDGKKFPQIVNSVHGFITGVN